MYLLVEATKWGLTPPPAHARHRSTAGEIIASIYLLIVSFNKGVRIILIREHVSNTVIRIIFSICSFVFETTVKAKLST